MVCANGVMSEHDNRSVSFKNLSTDNLHPWHDVLEGRVCFQLPKTIRFCRVLHGMPHNEEKMGVELFAIKIALKPFTKTIFGTGSTTHLRCAVMHFQAALSMCLPTLAAAVT